jgi:NADH dehydrogenase (ubiquinone) Fe-S protein 7
LEEKEFSGLTVQDAVKPASALIPIRAASAAAFSTTSRQDATSLTPSPHSSTFGKARKEVALPSEEGTKGVIQYALYV